MSSTVVFQLVHLEPISNPNIINDYTFGVSLLTNNILYFMLICLFQNIARNEL